MTLDDLGDQERAVLDAVTANPFAGQQEIATSLGLARSTVAAHIVQLVQKGYILGRGYVLPAPKRIVCLGGAAVDRKYITAQPVRLGRTNPAEGRRSFGGVARNVAETLARLGVLTGVASIVGDDENGQALLRHLRDLGIDVAAMVVHPERATADYVAIIGPDSSVVVGFDDMGIFDHFSLAHLERAWPHLASASWVFAECNLPAEVLAALFARKEGGRFRLAVSGVVPAKAARLPADLSGVDLLFLTLEEARALAGDGDVATVLARLAARGARDVVVMTEDGGAVVVADGRATTVAPVPARAVDVTGTADALIAGTLYRVLAGERLVSAVRIGALAAALTAETDMTVLPGLSPRLLAGAMHRLPDAAGAPR